MKAYYKGSYTVEAAWLTAILLSITCFAILFGYQTYRRTLEGIARPPEQIEAAQMFRSGERLRQLAEKEKGEDTNGASVQEEP